jgi:tetratricopeptide (TPR) repeat protein
LLLIFTIFPSPAHADAGVGMLVVTSVPIWAVLLLFIVPLEAKIAEKVFELPLLACLKISTLANLASTVAGVLITCASLLCCEVVSIKNPNTLWIFNLNELLWCIPCFYLSVWIEAVVAAKVVQPALQKMAHQWAWRANIASYSILAALLSGLLIWSIADYVQKLNSDEFCDVDRISAERVWQAQYRRRMDTTWPYRQSNPYNYQELVSGTPATWLKDECIKSQNAYDPFSDDKAIAILEAAITRYDHASPSLVKATPKDDLRDALLALANCYHRQNRFDEAKRLRLRCRGLDYDDSSDLLLADEYLQTGELNSANEIYEKVASLYHSYDRGRAILGLGNVAEKQKESAKAEGYFKKAKQLFFDHGTMDRREYMEACVQLARFYTSEKRYADAERLLLDETEYQQSISQNGPMGEWPIPEYLFALSDCYFAQGEYDEAERCIKQAMRDRGPLALREATNKYADFLQKRGLASKAAVWRQRAKEAADLQAAIR